MSDTDSGLDFGFTVSEGATVVDPNGVSDTQRTIEPAAPSGRKRRSDAGIPRGTRGTGKTRKPAQVDLSALTGMFVGIHAMLAMQTRTPELEITQDEGEQFMGAAQNVLRHYSVSTTQKTLDWIAFVGITGVIYVPRAVAIGNRRRDERRDRATARVVRHPRNPPFTARREAVAEEPVVIEPDMMGDDL